MKGCSMIFGLICLLIGVAGLLGWQAFFGVLILIGILCAICSD